MKPLAFVLVTLFLGAKTALLSTADCPLQRVSGLCGPEQQYSACAPINGMLPPPGMELPPIYDSCRCLEWYPGSGLPWFCTARVTHRYLVTGDASLFPEFEVEQILWCESEMVEVWCYRFPHCRNTGQYGGTEGSVLCALGQLCSPAEYTTCKIKVPEPTQERCNEQIPCVAE